MNTYRVALVQQRAVSRDIRRNTELAFGYVRPAKQLGADVVLFPEMWSNYYSLPDIEESSPADYPRIVNETR